MSLDQETANSLPSDFDVNGLTKAFNNPTETFHMLDLNGDGQVTKEDLQLLLEKFGVKGVAGKMLAKFIFNRLDADMSGTITTEDLTHANSLLLSLLKMKKN